MTGIRQSFAFCRERDGYGTGIGESSGYEYNFIHVAPGSTGSNTFVKVNESSSKDYWVAPPPGSYFSHTSSRSVNRVQTTGSKFWDAQAYGQHQGSWEWSFVLDTKYIEPLLFAFEDSALTNVNMADMNYPDLVSGNFRNYYRLTKTNNVRVRSFTVKIVIDDAMIGGGYNEVKILKGCVVKDIRFSKDTGTSIINVNMSGFYANESIIYDASNPVTIYKEPVDSPSHFEWMAAYMKNTSTGATEYMSDVSSMSLSVGNSTQAVYTICSPFSSNFAEGQTTISLSVSSYYTDPRQYRETLMTLFGNSDTYVPSSKGMRPMSKFYLVSSSQNATGTTRFQGVFIPGTKPVEPILPSSNRNFAIFEFSDMAIKSLAWEKGDGGAPLQDKIDGNDCRLLSIGIGAYASGYSSSSGGGMFHKILTIDGSSATFNGTLKNPKELPGVPSDAPNVPNSYYNTDRFEISDSSGALASARQMYNVPGEEDNPTLKYQNLDGWFAPYYYDSVSVVVRGYRWEVVGKDEDNHDVYGWVFKTNLNSEYGDPKASGWIYSSHFAEPFTPPGGGRSMGFVSQLPGPDDGRMRNTDLDSDEGIVRIENPEISKKEEVSESLINTDEENNEI